MFTAIPANSTEVTELTQFLEEWMNLTPAATHFYQGDNLEDVTDRVREACCEELDSTKSGKIIPKRSWFQRLLQS